MAKPSDDGDSSVHIAPHHGAYPLRVYIGSSADLAHFRDNLELKLLAAEGLGRVIKLSDDKTVVLGSYPREYLRTIAKHIEAATIANEANRPGARLSRLTQWCMTAEAHQLIIWPAIMDMQVEYADERNAGRPIRALLILIRGYASVLRAWLYGLIAQAIRRMFSV
jgi:hypothetical protein